MADPIVTGAGLGAVISSIFYGVTRLIPVIAKSIKPETNSRKSVECKPGKANICIDRGITLSEHGQTLKHLTEIVGNAKTERGEIKKEIKDGFKEINRKLDKI